MPNPSVMILNMSMEASQVKQNNKKNTETFRPFSHNKNFFCDVHNFFINTRKFQVKLPVLIVSQLFPKQLIPYLFLLCSFFLILHLFYGEKFWEDISKLKTRKD